MPKLKAKTMNSRKTKTFTFRISDEVAQDLADVKEKCKSLGVVWNVTETLTKALVADIKAVERHIQDELKQEWSIGQQNLDMPDSET